MVFVRIAGIINFIFIFLKLLCCAAYFTGPTAWLLRLFPRFWESLKTELSFPPA